jgi:hypothetical protein
MKEKISVNLKSLKFIFNKNKFYIYPSALILVSILLFFQFVIPEFNLLLKTQEEVNALKAKTELLKKNLNMLTKINQNTLDSQYDTMILALPIKKDYIEILDAVNVAAQKAGVNLGNYSFKVGILGKSGAEDISPVIKLSVPIESGLTGVNSFVQIINNTVPLSQIDSVNAGDTSSSITLSFYYKLLDTSNYSQDALISPVSKDGLSLINQMKEFKTSSSFSMPVTPIATASAAKQVGTKL